MNPGCFDVAVVEIGPGLAGVQCPKPDIRSTPVRAMRGVATRTVLTLCHDDRLIEIRHVRGTKRIIAHQEHCIQLLAHRPELALANAPDHDGRPGGCGEALEGESMCSACKVPAC
jgi:hypothetical protein